MDALEPIVAQSLKVVSTHPLTLALVEHALRCAVQEAYAAGQRAALRECVGVADAADRLGVHKSTVRRAVRQAGVGTLVGREWVLTPADLAVVRELVPGRPGRKPRRAA